MKTPVSADLLTIFRKIVEENKSNDEWAEVESDDMFQTVHYSGGFDATEMAFCFSHFDPNGGEFWFQLSLDEVSSVANAGEGEVEVRPRG